MDDADESEIEVDGSLRIPRVQCTRDAFFHFLPRLCVRDLICWALRTETLVRLAKISRRYSGGAEEQGSYSTTLDSKYLIDVYPEDGAAVGAKTGFEGRGRDEYMFSRKAHPQLTFMGFADDEDGGDYGGLTPIEIEESKKRKWDGGGYKTYQRQKGDPEAVVPPTMLHFEIVLEAYCGYSLGGGNASSYDPGLGSKASCYNSPDSTCPRSAVMGGAVVAALASYQDERVVRAFTNSNMFDETGQHLQEDPSIYWTTKKTLIHKLHDHFLSKEDLDARWVRNQGGTQTTGPSSPFERGDVDIFLQASPLTREVLGVLETNGIGGNPDLFDLIGSFVGNAGICENGLERYATTVVGEDGVIKNPDDSVFAFARSKHALSFILGKQYRDDTYGGKLWPRTSQFIQLDAQADLLGGLLDFDQSVACCSYDGVSVRVAPRAALSLMSQANFVTPFCFEELRNKRRVRKYRARGFKPFLVDPNDNGPRQNLPCDAVITRMPFAPPEYIDYHQHHDRHAKGEIVRIQNEKMEHGDRQLCCHELDGQKLGNDQRKLNRDVFGVEYTQMMFESSPGDAVDFFRRRFNWSNEDLRRAEEIDPYLRMACRKCRAEYNLIRVVLANYPDLMKEYDLEDDNLRGEFSYAHNGGAELCSDFKPSFYSGGVFDSTFVRDSARPVDKIASMLHSQSIFEVSAYVMRHGSPEGYFKRFVHGRELSEVAGKARKTLLQQPSRPPVGLNPERFVERCANCQNWLRGHRYGSRVCRRCREDGSRGE